MSGYLLSILQAEEQLSTIHVSVMCYCITSVFTCLLLFLERKRHFIAETASTIAGELPTTVPVGTTKSTIINPIYEPYYESPSGEPLRALLSSTSSTPSTPSTPSENPRYTHDPHPPFLPPPRKASNMPTVNNVPCHSLSSNIETDGISKREIDEEPEYALMKPIKAAKPPPLKLSAHKN